jgi:hypothetical protein
LFVVVVVVVVVERVEGKCVVLVVDFVTNVVVLVVCC